MIHKYIDGRKPTACLNRFMNHHKERKTGAWNFKEDISLYIAVRTKNGGKFITHIPIPRIV
jgi:hypothetical protein